MEWAHMFLFIVLAPIVLFALGSLIGSFIKRSNGVGDVIARVRNEENAQYVDQLVRYHNNRVRAGASDEESLARLMQELEEVEQGLRG